MRVPALIFADDELIAKMKTDRTLYQTVNVATLPGIYKRSFAMPDAHEGYGFPIGGVAAVDAQDGVISPGGVGYDINCLPAGTDVLTDLGYRVPIETVSRGASVACISGDRLSPTRVLLSMRRKDHVLFKVVTNNGIELTATADHPVLTPLGMVPAGMLKAGAKVATHPFRGSDFEPPSSFTIVAEEELGGPAAKELKERGLLPFKADSKGLPVVLKLLGYFAGKGAFGGEGTLFYGSREGMEELRRDVAQLGFVSSWVDERKVIDVDGAGLARAEHQVCIPSKSFRALFEMLGAHKGGRIEEAFPLPAWIERLPLWMKRLFLAGYFGARMDEPQTVDGFNFEPPVVSVSRAKEEVAEGAAFLNGIAELVKEFDVEARPLEVEKRGNRTWLKLRLSPKTSSLLDLWGRIGYIYAPRKRRMALAAVSWLRWKEKVVVEGKAMTEVVVEREGGTAAVDLVMRPNVSRIEMEGGLAEKGVREGRSSDPPRSCGFPPFEEWSSTNAQGDIVWAEVERVEELDHGDGPVFDITVENEAHNFVASGFVVSNCGVRLIRTNLSLDDVRPVLPRLLETLYNYVPSGVGSEGQIRVTQSELLAVAAGGIEWAVDKGYGWDADLRHAEEGGKLEWAKPEKVSNTALKRGAGQLGTLGSGNHFLEIETVDKVFDQEAAGAMGMKEPNQVLVLIHTGSRGFGHQVCSDYLRIMEMVMKRTSMNLPDRELAAGPVTAKETEDYLGAMASAANFAWANRQMITHWVRQAFEGVFKTEADKLDMHVVYDVAHNIVKLEEHVIDGVKRRVYVHRKGATRAFPPGSPYIPEEYRVVGQPVLIPGSMGTSSWVLKGTARGMKTSFGTAAHGAGRFMSRAAAKRAYGYEELLTSLKRRGILVRAASRETVTEEAPSAYKDVDRVVEVTHLAGLAEKVVRMIPMGVVKG